MIIHAYIFSDKETGLYYSTIPELPGVFSQGETIDKCIANTNEAAELALEDRDDREYFRISDAEILIQTEYLIIGEPIHVG
ncbi:MAG: hypothetical protein DRP50_08095 [Thermotoga sp.]|nr:MAG: hypothetical protein DRP50_08095 [Thermotoga sp.]